CCKDATLYALFLLDLTDQSVHELDVAVADPGLDGMNGVASYHSRGASDLDARQLGGARIQGVERDSDAGNDHAADVFALGRHVVERRRGTEVDDDRRRVRAFVRGDRVDDAIGADLARILVKDRHAGLDPGPDDERLRAEVILAERFHRAGKWRHDAGDDDPAHFRDGMTDRLEQAPHQDAIFVRRAFGGGGQAPVARQVLAVEQADHRVGVADVEREQESVNRRHQL